MFVVARRFEWTVEINMDALIRLCRNWQGGQRSRLRITLAGSLTPGAALDVLGDVEFEGRPPPGSGDSFLYPFNGTMTGQAVAVGFLQDVGAQTPRSVEKVSDLLPGIGSNPEPPMDIGGEAGFLLLHGQSDVAVEVVRPTTRSPEFDEGPDFWVLVLVVSHAGGGQVDGVNLKFES